MIAKRKRTDLGEVKLALIAEVVEVQLTSVEVELIEFVPGDEPSPVHIVMSCDHLFQFWKCVKFQKKTRTCWAIEIFVLDIFDEIAEVCVDLVVGMTHLSEEKVDLRGKIVTGAVPNLACKSVVDFVGNRVHDHARLISRRRIHLDVDRLLRGHLEQQIENNRRCLV